MQVLVTGGFGFVGRALTGRLLDHGHDVCVVDDLSTAVVRPPWFEGKGNLQTVIGHLSHVDLPDLKLDAVVHLAGPAGSLAILQRAGADLEVRHGVRRAIDWAMAKRASLIFLSTSEVLASGGGSGMAQTPRGRYVSAVRQAELDIAYIMVRAGLDYKILRSQSIAGPFQRGDLGFVVPRMIEQARAGRPVTVFGDGCHVHEFIHVDDVARALEVSLYERSGVYHLSHPLNRIRLDSLARLIIGRTSSASRIAYLDPRRAVHSDYRWCSAPVCPNRVRLLDDWRPECGIQRIVSDAIRRGSDRESAQFHAC